MHETKSVNFNSSSPPVENVPDGQGTREVRSEEGLNPAGAVLQ